MVDHGARDHAQWSASATARNWHCPGALTLAQHGTVVEKESIHSARGTACHQLSEKALRTGKDVSDFLGTIEKTKQHEVEIDEELVNSAQMYVDYVRGAAYREEGEPLLQNDKIVQIEQRFVLDDLAPPFEAGGTGDAVLYTPTTKRLEIVDLKNGMGVVDAKENPQLRTYALGAMLANPDLDVESVTVTIVQPRAPHKDGRIRSETFDVADLIGWTVDLLKAMDRSKLAMDAYEACSGNSILLDEWTDRWLNPGKCTFCPVEGQCPKLRKKALEAAAVFFEPETDQPKIGNSALDTSPEALARDLDMIPMIEDWIKARRGYAHTVAETGTEIPGYMLVDKIGNRKWGPNELSLRTTLIEAGVANDDLFVDPKLKSPAQMEKLLGAKRKALIEPFVTREVTGLNLVAIDKTTRPPAKSKAEQFIETE